MIAQQADGSANAAQLPSGNPGLYIKDGGGWRAIAPSTPTKVKAKHAFASSLTYGAVAAPVVAVYSGAHAQVQMQGARPLICVYHIMTTDSPLLVRLVEKKGSRELDSGHVRASLTGSGHQAVADARIVVPTPSSQPEDRVILLQPQTDLLPGEYAVMFGAQNLAIFDFSLSAP